jgi:hypothetical protein
MIQSIHKARNNRGLTRVMNEYAEHCTAAKHGP